MTEKAASRTAILVCQGRAVADDRLAPGYFHDPIAIRLLREDERAAVRRAREEAPPTGWRERMEYELLTATSAVLATRTVAIDEELRAAGNRQVVLLGAGLDGRAWRLRDAGRPATEIHLFEVDHPASQSDKRARARDLEPVIADLTYVPVEFGRDDPAVELAAAGHRDDIATSWVWEGVLPYLTRPQVDSTLTAVRARSAAGSRVIATYPTPNRFAVLGRAGMRVFSRLSGGRDPLADEPHLSAWSPQQMRETVSRHGFEVTSDMEMIEVARRLGIEFRQSRAYGLGRMVVADLPG